MGNFGQRPGADRMEIESIWDLSKPDSKRFRVFYMTMQILEIEELKKRTNYQFINLHIIHTLRKAKISGLRTSNSSSTGA